MSALLRFDEVIAMFKVKKQFGNLKLAFTPEEKDLEFCYDILQKVSRSFAAVIIQLHPELRDAVCIFYLVLRGLDTVEDDMSIPVDEKKKVLPFFHENLYKEKWCVDGIGKQNPDELRLLQEFYRCSSEFRKLKPEYRDVISDICEKMANGMCHFLTTTVKSTADYNLYCHYVAGLVGHGLTRLFAVSGLEDPHMADDLSIANNMGLFLQKTNIIRDYYEDIVEDPPRIFWPKDIWGTFTDDIHKFKQPENRTQALECLNAMVADALQHIPDCLKYLAGLKEQSVFMFCAIPQVMAIATLSLLYNNPAVFNDKVKIRRGLTCKIILNCGEMTSVLNQFDFFLRELEQKLLEDDPSYDVCRQRILTSKQHNALYIAAHEKPSYRLRFFHQFPALGGRLLNSLVDGLGNVLH